METAVATPFPPPSSSKNYRRRRIQDTPGGSRRGAETLRFGSTVQDCLVMVFLPLVGWMIILRCVLCWSWKILRVIWWKLVLKILCWTNFSTTRSFTDHSYSKLQEQKGESDLFHDAFEHLFEESFQFQDDLLDAGDELLSTHLRRGKVDDEFRIDGQKPPSESKRALSGWHSTPWFWWKHWRSSAPQPPTNSCTNSSERHTTTTARIPPRISLQRHLSKRHPAAQLHHYWETLSQRGEHYSSAAHSSSHVGHPDPVEDFPSPKRISPRIRPPTSLRWRKKAPNSSPLPSDPSRSSPPHRSVARYSSVSREILEQMQNLEETTGPDSSTTPYQTPNISPSSRNPGSDWYAKANPWHDDEPVEVEQRPAMMQMVFFDTSATSSSSS
mmetsp:Transcript_60343/g.174156  ORF Transcript_60343/g.174156 Transcript_60343/m.174156 type:complete len:385 (+) Transcript_60343:166-1320(+)